MRLLSAALLCLFISIDSRAQCVPPTITTAPAARYAILPGSTASLSVEATGTDLTYRWFFIFRISLIEHTVATTPSVSLSPYYPATTYHVTVSNGCGSASAQTLVCLIPVASISTLDLTSTNEVLLSAALDPRVVSSGSLYTFQWYRGERGDTSSPAGPPVTAPSSAHLTVSALTPATYWVWVDGVCEPYESESVTVAGTTAIPALSGMMLAALASMLAVVAATALRPH